MWERFMEDMQAVGLEANAVKTNADHIRSMTDEELMQFLFNEIPNDTVCAFCVPTMRTKVKCNGHCKNGIMDWLKQPYKEDA